MVSMVLRGSESVAEQVRSRGIEALLAHVITTNFCSSRSDTRNRIHRVDLERCARARVPFNMLRLWGPGREGAASRGAIATVLALSDSLAAQIIARCSRARRTAVRQRPLSSESGGPSGGEGARIPLGLCGLGDVGTGRDAQAAARIAKLRCDPACASGSWQPPI